ncbi:hypothetical protein D9M69_560230 [compost metagenome]
MPAQIIGALDVERMLLSVDMRAKKRAVRRIYDEANKIAEIAREMAPVDEGYLEKSIKVSPSSLERARDEMGRFVRTDVSVFVDEDMMVPTTSGKQKRVGDYAYMVHEWVTPYGMKNLGPLSQEKQMSTSYVVGGGFLERAADMRVDDLVQGVAEDLREEF